jgi:putative aldouronate transport system substrate-binding protein
MKKTIIFMLVLSLAFTAFATGAQESSSQSVGESKSEILGPGNVVIKSMYQNISWDPNTDLSAKLIEEVTGYKAEYYTLPAQNADEKLSMEIASGADYDIIRCSVNQFNMLLSAGALMPLNDLLSQYGEKIKAGYSQEVWDAVSRDGVVYGIPYKYAADREVASFISCRWDLMEAAGIKELPTTLDEFYNCLVTLKRFYGDKYIILTGPYLPPTEKNENWSFPKVIASAFGIYGEWMLDENGKVYYMSESEQFDDMLQFMNKLYAEGLVDADWAVNTNDSVCEKFASGKAIMCCSSRTGCVITSPAVMKNQNIDWSDIRYINPLTGEDGKCTYMLTEAISSVSVIPRSCKHPADVFNWLNLKLDNQLYLNFGVEGTHFTYDGEGNMEPINPIFGTERGNSYWYCNAMDMAAYQKDWPARIRKSEAQWQCWKGTTLITAKERPEIFIDNPFKFMSAEANYSKFNASLHTALNDYVVQVICGSKSMADISDLQKNLAASNIEAVKAELQRYLDKK